MKRPGLALPLCAAVLVAGAGAVAASPASAASGCRVTYAVSSEWPGGFGANVTIDNLGDPISSWTLAWSYSAGQQVTQAWNATVTQSGPQVTATNAGYNGSVGTAGSVSFGFNGSWSGSNPVPTAFTLNGTPCTGGVSGSPSPTPSASPSPSPTAVSPTPSPSPARPSPSPSPSPSASPTGKRLTMLGADVSTLQRAADLGAKYYDASGAQRDPLDILKGIGANYVRLRIWNNPVSGYNNKAKVLQYARTVKAKGLKLLVDFHYSDTWADPGKQYKPAAWASHGIAQLQTDVYNYTYDVCSSLKAQGTTPDSVQIGNEINVGMLWNDGKVVDNDFTNLSLLLKAGYNATKACNSGTQVIIHTADADSDANARWFYDGIRAKGVPWDITGLSYYCYWHGTMSTMASVVADMKSRYGKDVILAETAYPYTTANADGTPNVISSSQPCSGYQATPAGQGANFTAVQNTARDAGAIGVFYWEPTWYAVPGNGWDPADINGSGDGWDNQAIFDRNGRLNPNVRWTP
ncbi:glycosyl hydrolase 53 family protein [Microbispora rosea]|uniref:glycosyl hydrolase 53 family protein n=1 Tax=Microbispora rosea TaxID=58117 RepID=UPI003405ACFE